MSTLILPVAGQSSRFPGMRPKWLLTMPSGRLMYEESVIDVDTNKFDRIIVTCLREHIDNYVSFDRLLESAKKNISNKVEFCVLDKPTSSHSETIYRTLRLMSIKGSFYLKDCDNRFKVDFVNTDSVATISLNDIDLIDAKNKSYVVTDDNDKVTNIVEKTVISSDFCCGGYSFSSSDLFNECYEHLRDNISSIDVGEIYISHVIFEMLLRGTEFSIHRATDYSDWGTIREYRYACRQMYTVFCDLDGVLFENASKFGKDGWKSELILKNVRSLVNLQKEGRIYLIITTSRPKSEASYVEEKLNSVGLKIDQALWGLPHCKRVLVNDFSATNPYPTAISINLARDSESLSDFMIQMNAG